MTDQAQMRQQKKATDWRLAGAAGSGTGGGGWMPELSQIMSDVVQQGRDTQATAATLCSSRDPRGGCSKYLMEQQAAETGGCCSYIAVGQ
jgi:hypothetical protein